MIIYKRVGSDNFNVVDADPKAYRESRIKKKKKKSRAVYVVIKTLI